MSFTWPFLLGPVFFRTTLPCFGGMTWRGVGCRYMMAVGINREKGATKNQGAGVKYMG